MQGNLRLLIVISQNDHIQEGNYSNSLLGYTPR